jgi:hypothetical protein
MRVSSQRMPISDKEEAIILILHPQETLYRAKVIA